MIKPDAIWVDPWADVPKDDDGNCQRNGTFERPFKTISDAIEKAEGENQICVAGTVINANHPNT